MVILYGAVMAGLLFLALAFFAVAQASAVRSGGQSAADAAALAAARDDRDRAFEEFLDSLGDKGDKKAWQDWLALSEPLPAEGCDAAAEFAGRNDSSLTSCEPVARSGDPGYTVRIETNFDTGDTVIPGADNKSATADATAVVRPRCGFDADSEEVEFTCDGEEFEIDPDEDEDGDEIDLEPDDLFAVVLVE